MEQFPAFTLDVLDRDTHTILERYGKSDETALVRIPYFFLYLYDKVVKDLSRNLGFGFLAEWKFFEKFIAEYEVYPTNALVSLGKETVTLRGLYRGALGSEVTLNRTVKLRYLRLVEPPHQFPCSPLTDMDWRSPVVIKNAESASFADVFVYREGAGEESDNILCALQPKKLKAPVSAKLLTSVSHRIFESVRGQCKMSNANIRFANFALVSHGREYSMRNITPH
ncbi:hypothetical protein BGX27_002362 [Mortierella sp. AM989]|nr:hypothetical protein BGX27_002362 [Mortierella sp. AM989]